ncbi:glycosyl transferase family 8 [Microcoleus sp. LEGE 07076]|uniref:glycosyltransferase family 8 protein n=1 Tax=Microcoleus sp. LEGE 07076 TaxID=915322 RepID=UPI00187F5F35|nr:glycosyltransferase [Microcoleus sp. LEGE 07076]MBE9187488.1 glycosyl transferase family 8 [Microcoleus sp. LEGE 07076]
MHIFVASDRNHILGLAALLKSLDINVSKSADIDVKISVVSVGIDAQQKQRLQDCCKYQIEWQEFQSNYDELLSLFGSKLSYVKLEPGKYTKATERLIWLDSDTIVLGSLEPLWNLDLGTMPVAASANVWGNPNNSQDRNPYFNTGVLVYNMKLWEQEQLSEKLLQNADSNLWGDHDQGALNSVLAGRWKQLDRIWNNDKTDDMSTKVMHFMSQPKPWESSAPNQLWLDMLSLTPFKDEQKSLQNNSGWLSFFKQKYTRIEPWLREPAIKFKSYVQKQKR